MGPVVAIGEDIVVIGAEVADPFIDVVVSIDE